ncbi:MAG TPA: metallophosphoesterase [Longimicrobium sp.]|nr:metallophosphoesterase [Longimicrobium sp.]
MIWHFSDLHFPPDPVALGRRNPAGEHDVQIAGDPFEELFDYISDKEQWKGGFLVVSGDFIAGAAASDAPSRTRAFRQARRFVEKLEQALRKDLPCIVVVCPGNHDVDRTDARNPGKDSLRQYKAAFGNHVSPGKKPSIDDNGACLLTLDTTRLCGRVLEVKELLVKGSKTVQIQFDASLFDRGEIRRALRRLKSSKPTILERVAQGRLLGIVIGHHQPTLTPSVWPELEPFENPSAAAQMKLDLLRQGFQVFLHGHKHTSVAHQEAIFPLNRKPAEGLLVLGAPGFFAAGGEDRGFNVIEYLVSPSAGEARVLLHPHALIQTRPRRLPCRRFDLPPRVGTPAAAIRLTVVIDEQGDCRLDTEYLEIPLPVDQDASHWGGWQLCNRRWVRHFERHVVADLNVTSPQGLLSFPPDVRVERLGAAGAAPDSRHRYSLRVSAPKSTSATHASFVERVFMHGAFAVSQAHQARIAGAASVIPGARKGYEAVMHVMRDPARRLEFVVEMPFPLDVEYEMDVQAYVARDGYFVEDAALFDFSPPHRASNSRAQRLYVAIDSPVVGVAYVVRWKLPADVPVPTGQVHLGGGMDHGDRAERCRRRAYECRRPEISQEIFELLQKHVTGALATLPLHEQDRQSLRWSVYVPDRALFGSSDGTRTRLVPVLASTPIEPEWREWEAGRGMAGRAYAQNRVQEEVGPSSERYRDTPNLEQWLQPAIRAYRPPARGQEHSVLYGIPLRTPDQPTLVWGVFCIGTWREHSAFNLHERASALPAPPGETPTGLRVLEEALDAFSRRLSE